MVHCDQCGADAEEDRLGFCGDYTCCSPSLTLTCDCGGRLCYDDNDPECSGCQRRASDD